MLSSDIVQNNIGCGVWGNIFNGLVLVAFLLFLIIALLALIRWLFSRKSIIKNIPEKTALDILKERYAKGEIDKLEFEEKKKDLNLN